MKESYERYHWLKCALINPRKIFPRGKRNHLLLIKCLQKIGIARGWQTREKEQRDTNWQPNQVETIPANVKPHTWQVQNSSENHLGNLPLLSIAKEWELTNKCFRTYIVNSILSDTVPEEIDGTNISTPTNVLWQAFQYSSAKLASCCMSFQSPSLPSTDWHSLDSSFNLPPTPF